MNSLMVKGLYMFEYDLGSLNILQKQVVMYFISHAR